MLHRRRRPGLGLSIPLGHCYEGLNRLCCSGLYHVPLLRLALVACCLRVPSMPSLGASSASKSRAASVGLRSASMRGGLSYGFASSKRDGFHLSSSCRLICSREKCNDCVRGWLQ